MNQIIKSTAHVVLFLMVDETDFVTAETSVSATVQVSKAGGSFATTTNSATEIANGWYKVTLTTTETNTEGELVVRATGTGCAEWRDKYIVVDATDYMADVSSLATSAALATVDGIVDDILVDTGTTLPGTLSTLAGYVDTEVAAILAAVDTEVAAIKAKTDNLPASPAAVGSQMTLADSAITAAKIATDAITAAKIAANAIGASELATDAVTEIQSGLATAAALATVDGIVDSILADTNELQLNQGNWLTADVSALATAAALATVDGIVDSILADTNELQLNQGNWTTADVSGLATAAALATVDTVVDSILEDTGTTLPATLAGLATAAALATVDGIVDTILADTAELQTNQGNWLTADVSGLATSAALATVDANVDAVLEDTGTTLPTQITALNNLSAAQVWAALGDTEKNAIADAVLSRGVNNVEDTADALSLTELVLAAFESAISGVTWTIYKSDHATTFGTRTVTADADADAIVEVT